MQTIENTQTKTYEIISAKIARDYKIKNGFAIQWLAKNVGFGILTFYEDNGKTIVQSEYMSKEFCKAVMEKFFEDTEIIGDNYG